MIKKTPSKLETKGIFPNLIKSTYKKPTANIIPNGEILNTFPQIKNKSRLSALNLPIQHFTRHPSQCGITQEK